MADALVYHYRTGCVTCNGGCVTCNGDGVTERQLLVGQEAHVPCPACEGTGWRWVYRALTPADLLTDPRVWALVEAVERLRDWPDQYPRHHGELMKALAPFEGVPRG